MSRRKTTVKEGDFWWIEATGTRSGMRLHAESDKHVIVIESISDDSAARLAIEICQKLQKKRLEIDQMILSIKNS